MTLKDYVTHNPSELEIWDKDVDVSTPVYFYGGHSYENNGEDHDLFLMEKWFLSLDATMTRAGVCCVNAFDVIAEEWSAIVERMKLIDGYSSFLKKLQKYGIDNDELIADFVEDIFTCLAYGYYSFAKDFCFLLNIDDHSELCEKIAERFENKQIAVVPISVFPDSDKIDYIEIESMKWDASQGSGNVIIRYFYIPALDILCCFADF